jgi:TldD protein
MVVGALALAACPSRPTTGPVLPIPTPGDTPTELPAIPSKIELTRIEPRSGHKPEVASPILGWMAAENERWMGELKKRPEPAHYLSYQIADQRVVSLEAEGGALIDDSDERQRNLDVDLRVGSAELDNTRSLSDDPNGANNPMVRRGTVPFGDEPLAIRKALWLETDRRYREGVGQLTYVRQDQSTIKNRGKAIPDFARSEPVSYAEPIAALGFDKAAWIERLKTCSAKACAAPPPAAAAASSSPRTPPGSSTARARRSSSRGPRPSSRCRSGSRPTTAWACRASSSASRSTRPACRATPTSGVMIDTVTSDLDALHDAPLAEPYVGPAILEGRAAGVFFHEVFGHRIEGHRQKDDTSGQTFASYVGKDIAPSWLSVYDDATVQTLNGLTRSTASSASTTRAWSARRVPLIDQGTLVGFLLGRNPILGFPGSNGHGRKEPGLPAVARQGNLVVEAARSVEKAELEKLLIAELERQCSELKQCRDYGMIFTDISGGFTNTSAFAPQAFKVNPVMAYRLYKDGRRELVRGIDISGTPLAALQSIRAASREVETFNGVCGAESGWVPVSASAPSLLIEKLEIESSFTPQDRPPILAPPALTTAATAGGTP